VGARGSKPEPAVSRSTPLDVAGNLIADEGRDLIAEERSGRKDATEAKLNTNQLSVSVSTVRELLDQQFPHWADKPITEGPSAGAGNALFRLGDDLVVRLPLHLGSAAAVDMELTWLPWLASQLPLAVPIPVAAGAPDEVFPRPWAVFRWLRGVGLDTYADVDLVDVAVRLGQFVAALRNIEVTGAPASLRPTPYKATAARSTPISVRLVQRAWWTKRWRLLCGIVR
jgi:aminoglycoside phosphotransferase (APT) family kinase protein